MNINEVVKSDLCLGCGICAIDKNIDFKYDSKRGIKRPILKKGNENSKVLSSVCPGSGYDIVKEAKNENFGPNYKLEIGFYDELKAVKSVKKEFTAKASSAGIMTKLVSYLMDENLIDGAIVTEFVYLGEGPTAKPFIAYNKEDLERGQGSKYCPVSFDEIMQTLSSINGKKRFAFIGTPCQIAGVRTIQKDIKDLGVKYFIGNFCGGYRSQNNLNQLILQNNIKPKDVGFFRFRGGGQPGSMLMKSFLKNVEIPYPKYVRLTGYHKLKRCLLCVDATAELADFSCGDAWLDRFEESEKPTSIIVTRTKIASEIMKRLEEKEIISVEDLSVEDLIYSQKGNITSKKYRQESRIKLYKRLMIGRPNIPTGYVINNKTNLRFELKVFVSHKIKLGLENLGLYYKLYVKNSWVNNFREKIKSVFKF